MRGFEERRGGGGVKRGIDAMNRKLHLNDTKGSEAGNRWSVGQVSTGEKRLQIEKTSIRNVNVADPSKRWAC